MPKRIGTFALTLPPREPRTPAYRWLGDALRTEILEGRLRPAVRLPATRDLARQYGLSRGTIVNAFEELKAEGYLRGSVGSGTYVSKVVPDDLLQFSRKTAAHLPARPEQRRRISNYGRLVNLFPNYELRPPRAFRTDQPAVDFFPTTLWAQIAARRCRLASMNLLLGGAAMGYRPLQEAVADYLHRSRGVKCAPEQVAIVSGVQEALDLVARLFLNPGDRVCMENPGYVGAAHVFQALGAKICPVSLDDEGMRLREPSLRKARLIYVTPAHQFPLGITMSLPRRLALLELARKIGAAIIEDDYDSEYRYSGRPIPALQGLDRNALVFFAGSFNKVLFPSLRLGYLVVPLDMVDYFAATLSITTRHAPVLEQAVLCDFITGGHFGRHVRRMREIYAERLSVLLECAQMRLSGLLEIAGIEAGLQIAGWLSGTITEEAAAKAAEKRDVEVTPLRRYSRTRSARAGLLLGFAAVETKEIRRGVRELAIVLESESKARAARSSVKR